MPRQLVCGEPVTERQEPSIFRHRYTALQTQKVAKLPGLTIKTASEMLDALFGDYARSAATTAP